jgi:hypothetical protein
MPGRIGDDDGPGIGGSGLRLLSPSQVFATGSRGFCGIGFQLQRNAPVRASNARTSPPGLSTRSLSATLEPTEPIGPHFDRGNQEDLQAGGGEPVVQACGVVGPRGIQPVWDADQTPLAKADHLPPKERAEARVAFGGELQVSLVKVDSCPEQIITSKSCIHFRKWTVDDGPLVWDDKEVWKEIEDDLERGDVSGAAGTLRRFLEYSASQLSGRLRASIEFHGDAQYDFGELMPAVIATWKDLLARAQEAAQSWNKKDEVIRISGLQKEFATRVGRTQVEQWAINRSIHYNEWANLQKEEFRCVVEAFRLLLGSFQCTACTGYVYVTPPKGAREGVRCDCGTFSMNLKKKTI